MIKAVNHLALIVSSEKTITLYEKLGFQVTSRVNRGYDEVVWLDGYNLQLEVFIDPTHPPRVDAPEAMGLRHFGLIVDDIEKTLSELQLEKDGIIVEPIRERSGKKYTFIKDYDGIPIELSE